MTEPPYAAIPVPNGWDRKGLPASTYHWLSFDLFGERAAVMRSWPSAAMTDAHELLPTPLGEPGSGRVRDGAAVELHCKGLISEAQLNVYAEAAAHDARDPAQLLADRGLPQLTHRVRMKPFAGS